MDARLLALLRITATACSDSFATALEIYAVKGKIEEIIELLDSHSHLLRPRDCDAFQAAARALIDTGHKQRALAIMEKELLDTTRAIRQSLLPSYSQLETPANKSEIAAIMKTRAGSAGRQNRVEAWVDAITTPGAEQPNPFVFAEIGRAHV